MRKGFHSCFNWPKNVNFLTFQLCLEIYRYINTIDNPLITPEEFRKECAVARSSDIHYPDSLIAAWLPFWTNPGAKNAGLISSQKCDFYYKRKKTTQLLFLRTLWVLPHWLSNVQIRRPINKYLSFISTQSLLTFVVSRHFQICISFISFLA